MIFLTYLFLYLFILQNVLTSCLSIYLPYNRSEISAGAFVGDFSVSEIFVGNLPKHEMVTKINLCHIELVFTFNDVC